MARITHDDCMEYVSKNKLSIKYWFMFFDSMRINGRRIGWLIIYPMMFIVPLIPFALFNYYASLGDGYKYQVEITYGDNRYKDTMWLNSEYSNYNINYTVVKYANDGTGRMWVKVGNGYLKACIADDFPTIHNVVNIRTIGKKIRTDK